MTTLSQAEAEVAAAHERLRARSTALRADWHKVQTAYRSALTGPAVLVGISILGVFLGARSRSARGRERISNQPSISRILLLAAATPVVKAAVASALAHLVAGHDVRPVADVPPAPGLTPGATE